uniref:Curved DNA-binding protein n=1 Tax=Tetraselmis sp. GSL018 TaxID=582737 RepID=A0A061QGH8_9CHLO
MSGSMVERCTAPTPSQWPCVAGLDTLDDLKPAKPHKASEFELNSEPFPAIPSINSLSSFHLPSVSRALDPGFVSAKRLLASDSLHTDGNEFQGPDSKRLRESQVAQPECSTGAATPSANEKQFSSSSNGGSVCTEPDTKGYYNILGLEEDCSQEDVRKAYRSLAKLSHPDKSDSSCSQRFQQINEAYAVLSDPARRALYDKGEFDNPPESRQESSAEADLAKKTRELLQVIFGPQETHRGAGTASLRKCVEKTLPVTLEELVRGATKNLKVARRNGHSQVVQVVIQPGWREGTKLLFAGLGGEAAGDEPEPLDLVLVLKEVEHPLYKRQGDHLCLHVSLPLVTALCGGQLTLPGLSGEPEIRLNMLPGINPYEPFRIRGRGMPLPSDANLRGDLILQFKLALPQRLSNSQRMQLRAILSAPAGS